MRKMKWSTTLACGALVISTLAGVALASGTGQGSQADPLVTLSYVTKAVEDLEDRLAQRIDSRAEELLGQIQDESKTAAFMTVEVPAGQTLTLNVGTQLILRTGRATCKDGLVDLTDGSTLWGDLVENHLYIATESGQAVTVTAKALFLVQGGYSVS